MGNCLFKEQDIWNFREISHVLCYKVVTLVDNEL